MAADSTVSPALSHPGFNLYEAMSRLSRPRSYVGKFLLIAFLGVHVPLIALVAWVALTSQWAVALQILGVALLATLVGTGTTLWLQRQMLWPIVTTAAALRRYREEREPPSLPTRFDDEAGTLMSTAQSCVTELDALVTFRTDLMRMLSHDLTNNLLSAKLASGLIQRRLASGDVNPDEQRELAAVVADSLDRASALIANVSRFSRADASTLEADRVDVEIQDVLESVAGQLAFRADDKGVKVVVDAEEALRAPLDRSMVEQILSNLTDNAIKFSERGGTVRLEAFEADGDLVLRVADDGVGIPPEAQRRLFERYSTAHRKGTGKEPGTGLGMWICKVLTDAHDGTIEVRSQPGEGTTVMVRLPRREPGA